jgi:SAM-dependent methyltransferase
MEERQAEARARLLALSQRAELEGEPLSWFEELYSGADRDSDEIPWARMEAMPEMVEWIAQRPHVKGRALVIGCGLGDDAEWLAAAGFDVMAFDLSETCIRWCEERFPSSEVDYRVEDLLSLPHDWVEAFDLVIEIHILQAMPEEIRDEAVQKIPPLLAEGGHLLCIGRLLADRIPSEPSPPWPLTRTWLESRFSSLEHASFQHFVREDTPGIDRYVSAWSNPSFDVAGHTRFL